MRSRELCFIIEAMSYDILIRGGTVFDGEGSPGAVADVGIKGDRVADIGDLGNSSADLVVNAAGKYVAPGFVDITNHSDTRLTLFHSPALESMVMQGVTTIVGGNCGSSLAPRVSAQSLDAIKKWADPSTINVNWNTFGEFLEQVEVLRPGPNVGFLAGYGTLRRGVVGDEIRPLRPDEQEQITYVLRQSLEQGALGLSLGLSYGHERVSTTEEISEASRTAAEAGGIVKIHLRSEGKELLASINETIRIGRETGAAVHVSHLKAIGKQAWPLLPRALELLENARSSGLDITYDVSPYSTTGSALYLLLPAGARQAGFSELFRRLNNPGERRVIADLLKNATLHYDRFIITSAKVKAIVGKTLARIAQDAGLEPEEALIETVRANDGRVSIIGKTLLDENTRKAVEHHAAIIASDGFGMAQEAGRSGDLTHPRSFGAFPHFWHRFVEREKIMPPELAIKKMTSLPARRMGLPDRGVLRRDAAADVVVFDPRLYKDRATYANPYRYPAGMEWVLINGKPAVEQGKMVGARNGNVLRRA